ncbi:MAG: hypothetical protein ACM359_01225 [Bacillota bacterium]
MLFRHAILTVAAAGFVFGLAATARGETEPEATEPTTQESGVSPEQRRYEIDRMIEELNARWAGGQEDWRPFTPSAEQLGLRKNLFGHHYFDYPLHLRSYSFNPAERRFSYRPVYPYYYRYGYAYYYYHPKFRPYWPYPGY